MAHRELPPDLKDRKSPALIAPQSALAEGECRKGIRKVSRNDDHSPFSDKPPHRVYRFSGFRPDERRKHE
jgi:hypothetical protein